MAACICEQKRTTYSDGNWADISLVRCPADSLRFTDIVLDDQRIRMRDAAWLRYQKARIRGETCPEIIAWACLESDRPAHKVFPTLKTSTRQGEHFLSTNSFVTYILRELVRHGWLRWNEGQWYAEVSTGYPDWQSTADVVLHWLTAGERLWLERGTENSDSFTRFASCDPLLHVTAVGRCGYIRDYARSEMPGAAFNTSFFLLEHDDYISHHSALGDPYGLLVVDGAVIRPPLYHRTTLWQDRSGRWHISQIGMEDIHITLPDGITIYPSTDATSSTPQFAVNPAEETAIAVYTRYFGVETDGRARSLTPASKGRFEMVIIDREIMGWKRDGGLLIPQNGFVLSFAASRDGEPLTELGDLSVNVDALRGLLRGGQLTYSFGAAPFQGMNQAAQNGPSLVQDSQIVRSDDVFAREQFWISRMVEDSYLFGVVPTEFPIDVAETRAARIGIGIDAVGDLIVLAISGSSKGIARKGIDSVGATLVELAEQLKEAGAVHALNLDGGGSTQMFVEGGLYNSPGDRRGRQGVTYERMVPTIGFTT